MNNWKVILATIIIFGAGVITGGLLVDHVQHPLRHHAANKPQSPVTEPLPPPLRADLFNQQFVQQLDDKLDLSTNQAQKIQAIIAGAQQNSLDLWKLVSPQFRQIVTDTRQKIRSVLTPQQEKEFEVIMKQQRKKAAGNAPNAHSSSNAPDKEISTPTNGPAI